MKRVVLLLSLALAAPAFADDKKAPEAPSAATVELRRQYEQIQLENQIADQKLHKDLAKLQAEKQRRDLENSIAQQKLQADLAVLQADADRAQKQLDVVNKRAALVQAERRAKLDAELADSRDKVERARAGHELATAELAARRREIEQRELELRVKMTELQSQRTELDIQTAKINTELDMRDKRDYLKNRVAAAMNYPKEPFKNGVLTISDRRIALNDVITPQTADHVAERIDYFNNQSHEQPIFIVIDRSPGGSVEAGYKILKAMHGSPAPVYVVVKSFAASMAATIATLSKRSFAYPNAVILHHQMSYGWGGNMTDQRERLKEAEEWWKRLAAPIAAKMGVSLDDLVKRMYAHRSTGDWREFGDAARKLKWVDEIVETVREESYIKNPDAPPPHIVLPGIPMLPMPPPTTVPRRAEAPVEEVDARGHHFMTLPRLDPVDAYYLYNPDNYYRESP